VLKFIVSEIVHQNVRRLYETNTSHDTVGVSQLGHYLLKANLNFDNRPKA